MEAESLQCSQAACLKVTGYKSLADNGNTPPRNRENKMTDNDKCARAIWLFHRIVIISRSLPLSLGLMQAEQ